METNMKNTLIAIVLAFVVAFSAVPRAEAQISNVLPHTTLSGAVSDTASLRFGVAAAGTIAAGYLAVIDHEMYLISSISGTTVTASTRGYNGTLSTPHVSGAVVLYGPANYFYNRDFYGACTAANQLVLPAVSVNRNTREVNIYNCNNGKWVLQTLPDDVEPQYKRACSVPMQIVTSLTTFNAPSAVIAIGNETTPTAGSVYYATLFISETRRVTGLSVLNGNTAATDTLVLGVLRSDGYLIATTATAGTTAAGNNAFQDILLTTPQVLTGPARYWIAYQSSGNTTRFRTVTAPAAGSGAFTGLLSSSFTGSAGTINNLVGGDGISKPTALPTTLLTATGPLACIY